MGKQAMTAGQVNREIGKRVYITLFALYFLFPVRVQSQDAKHEFRGAWIATVINLDWPSTPFLSTSAQKAELSQMINGLADAGVNAVFFQVRAEGEAFYESFIEPWSQHLTGTQGLAPAPFYDPLEFAIGLAHSRGMELHAWFNPYRARRNLNDGITPDPSHVSVQHPEWLLEVGSIAVLNPGLADAREYVVNVVLDVVERYDIDGVHFDDYFYPESIGTRDLATYNANNPDNLSLDNWRRENVNQLIQAVQVGVESFNPDVKFGVSPPGIWQDGVPAGTTGSSGYSRLFADAVTWLSEEWVDYIAPQLYWSFGGGQDFALLAPWWASVSNGRHIYPGLAAYKADPATYGGTPYSPTELPDQIRFSRETAGIQGNIFFRAKYITQFASSGLRDTLETDLYANRAFTPSMDWREGAPPNPPTELSTIVTTKSGMSLIWTAPEPDAFASAPRRYAVYRMRSALEPDPRTMTNDPANLLAVVYQTHYGDAPPVDPNPYWYAVTALNANSVESYESNMISFNSTGLASETVVEQFFRVESAAPNPFRSLTTIRYVLERSGIFRAEVFDAIGRRVAVLENREQTRGPGQLTWDGRDDSGQQLSSGIYFVRLATQGAAVTRPVLFLR